MTDPATITGGPNDAMAAEALEAAVQIVNNVVGNRDLAELIAEEALAAYFATLGRAPKVATEWEAGR